MTASDPEKIIPSNIPSELARARKDMTDRLLGNPIPNGELLRNLGLFMLPQDLRRFLFLDEVYRQILGVHGVAMEFGVRWGRDLAVLQALRSIHEPFNYSRRIIGFDTFEGFTHLDAKDGGHPVVTPGAYGVSDGYETFLDKHLTALEQEAPVAHIKKFELVKGDASETVHTWLSAHPEAVISFAYFDMDVYRPTRDVLEAIRPRMPKGAIIGLDEVGLPEFPGETQALAEVFGLDAIRLVRSPYSNYESYFVL
jgi:hypothetical protein